MQCVVDALQLTDSLRVLVCNIEMPSAVLLDRQLARRTDPHDMTLRFDRKRQRFTPAITAEKPPDGKLQSTLATLWDRAVRCSQWLSGSLDWFCELVCQNKPAVK